MDWHAHCCTISPTNNNVRISQALVVDLAIDCKSDEHRAYETYASAMVLVFPIGVPLVYALLLFRTKDQRVRLSRQEDDDLDGLEHLMSSIRGSQKRLPVLGFTKVPNRSETYCCIIAGAGAGPNGILSHS